MENRKEGLRLACLGLFLVGGVLTFLANSALFQAVLRWRSPFETFEQSITPAALQGVLVYVAGIVVGLSLIIAGWAAVKMRLATKPERATGRPLALNLVLFTLAPLLFFLLFALFDAVFPSGLDFENNKGFLVLFAVLGLLLFVLGPPFVKLLIVRRTLKGQTATGFGRFGLVLVLYWPLVLLAVYLGQPLVAEIGWVGRISAGEGPALALAVWFLWDGSMEESS